MSEMTKRKFIAKLSKLDLFSDTWTDEITDLVERAGIRWKAEPLPEPPEPERVRMISSFDNDYYYRDGKWTMTNGQGLMWNWAEIDCDIRILAEPSYWADHPEYAKTYEAYREGIEG